MRPILEYISTKKLNSTYIPSKTTPIEYVEKCLKEQFEDNINENDKESQAMIEDINKIFDKNNFESIRVYSNSYKVNKTLKEEKQVYRNITIFKNILDHEYLIYDLIEDAKDNSSNYEDYTTNNYDYRIYNSDYYIYIERDDDFGMIFEKIDENNNPDPSINEYSDRNTTYIELSRRQLLAEIKNMPEEESFWWDIQYIYDDALENAKEELGIEIEVLGRNGKHVCTPRTMKALHNYDEIVKHIEKIQDDMKSQIQYEVDEYNKENKED